MPEVNIIIRAKDEASRTLQGIGRGLGGLGSALVGAGAVGGIALAGLTVAVGKLAYDAAQLEPIKITFDNLTKSIGTTADAMLLKLRPATMGMLSDADLMKAANKLMAMGLATSAEEAANLSEMAVTLGKAMGVDATTSLENFTLMLANQSIPRLDTFGISSGNVRNRIEELMEANEDMTRETAFMTAVMEEGATAMDKVGDVSETGAVKMEQLQARMKNVKDTLGTALMPLFEVFLTKVLEPIVAKIEEWAPKMVPVIEAFSELAKKILDPTEGDWVEYLRTDVYDTLEEVFGPDAARQITDFVEDAVTGIQEFVDESLIPLVTTIREDVIPAFIEWATSDGLRDLLDILRSIGDAIGKIIDAIRVLQDALDTLFQSQAFQWLARTALAGREISFQQVEENPITQWAREWQQARERPVVEARYQQAYAQQAYHPTTTNVNVYGLPGLEEEIREMINREGGRTLGQS